MLLSRFPPYHDIDKCQYIDLTISMKAYSRVIYTDKSMLHVEQVLRQNFAIFCNSRSLSHHVQMLPSSQPTQTLRLNILTTDSFRHNLTCLKFASSCQVANVMRRSFVLTNFCRHISWLRALLASQGTPCVLSACFEKPKDQEY